MRKVWMVSVAMLVLASPSIAGDKGLMGALLGAGAGAAIGHATDRTGGSGKGAVIGALGGYLIGNQMEKGEQKAKEAGRNEAQQAVSAPAAYQSGAQLSAGDCRAAEDYVSRAAASGDNGDRIYFLEKAVKLCPDQAQAHNDLGVAYYSRNERHDRDRAKNEFNDALRINPNYTVARDNLSSL
ncbi:MAG: glycine zipper domain-containing protein [Mariprofundaceae bacterium]